MNHSDSNILTEIDGFWVTAIPVPYPPTMFESIKHALGFCKDCWICADEQTQKTYRDKQAAELMAAKSLVKRTKK